VSRRLLVALAVVLSATALLGSGASAGRTFLVGIYDDAMIIGKPTKAFPLLHSLRAQVIRVNLSWRATAPKRPKKPSDPADPAYDWSVADRTVTLAAQNKIQVLFTIGTPPKWASGSSATNRAPKQMRDLQNFALAAATRYSGKFKLDPTDTTAKPLPAVKLWLAWNEPNNPVFLYPQYRRIGKRYVMQSAITYAQICTAVYNGVHSVKVSGEKVGCGATDPHGNNQPRSRRPSVSPLAFLRAVKKDRLRRFDAWAHHPYYGNPRETPTTRPRDKTSVTLGNIGDLTKELTRLYGRKPLWITEYGYQTKPPDRSYGVSWKAQAKYLAQAFALARRNPRIQMMIWFLIKDEPRVAGWQSGFFSYGGTRKPSFQAFQRLKH
jgi:hypothetical protein